MVTGKRQITLFLILLLGFFESATCDIPVHCLKSQVVGKWTLQYTSVQVKGNGYNQCGHAQPDNENSSNQAFQKQFQNDNTINVQLMQDNKVLDKENNESGSWTMVYDEGFDISYQEYSFFAFSKYEKNGSRYESHCDATLIGWYHNKQTDEKGCYRGYKETSIEKTDSLETVSVVQPKETQSNQQGFLEISSSNDMESNSNEQSNNYQEGGEHDEDQVMLIESLNDNLDDVIIQSETSTVNVDMSQEPENQQNLEEIESNDNQNIVVQNDEPINPEDEVVDFQTEEEVEEVEEQEQDIENSNQNQNEEIQISEESLNTEEEGDVQISEEQEDILENFETVMLQPETSDSVINENNEYLKNIDILAEADSQQFGSEPISIYLEQDDSELQDVKEINESSQQYRMLLDGIELPEISNEPQIVVEDKNSQNQQKSFRKRQDTDEDFLEMHKGFNEHHQVVKRLNKIEGKQWEAATSVGFSQMNMKEINNKAGRQKQFDKPFHDTFETVPSFNSNNFSEDEKYTKGTDQTYINFSIQDLGDLPKEYSDEQYINKPIQQRDCGSCYAIATMQMLSARLKKLYNENVMLSIQHTLDCNYYNQGCDGGYPYLVEKFASENDLVPENCSPYLGIDGKCQKCNVNNLAQTYRVSDYGFIGGAYGKTTEKAIMEEIKQNGPVVMSFEPAYDFIYYKTGVYHSVDAQDWILQGEMVPEWEKVDHSVLCYGWGETEDGQKYWNLLNSWGDDWGEKGHFRMRRGTDESHIESMGEAAIPIIVDQMSELLDKNKENQSFLGLNEQKDDFKNNFDW